jgi:glycosyltransferase involved in cell wall biosynthesis
MATSPKISIVTVVYNGSVLIERTIKSVVSQTYHNIEYIIIDGASKDDTIDIIKKYESKIAVIKSEKDHGIYDAMNKGLTIASGDYILFLNAGDELFSIDTISKIIAIADNADVFYGNTIVLDAKGNELGDRRLKPPLHLNWKSLKYGMCVSHQSFIAKKSLCEFYDLNYSISADIDWVISILKKSHIIINTHSYISKFLEGGTSNKNRTKALKQRLVIMIKHYGFFQTILNHLYITIRYVRHRFTRKSMT